jgi:hypothetical protein
MVRETYLVHYATNAVAELSLSTKGALNGPAIEFDRLGTANKGGLGDTTDVFAGVVELWRKGEANQHLESPES